MKKAALAGAALVLLVAVWALTAGPQPDGPPPPSAHEYPLGVWLRWEYRGAGNVAVVRETGGAVEIGGRRYREVDYVLPVLGKRTILMRHTPEGVVTTQKGREFLLLRFPMVKGDSWTVDLPSEKELAECTVLGDDRIEFKGQEATATKLEVRRRTRDGRPISTDYEWYAAGVGLVKMEVTLGVRATFVLKSFARLRANLTGLDPDPVKPP